MRCPAEGLNQSTRQQFVIDFLKTATLVPQIGKGIYQGSKDKEFGILGQLANNLGKNGFNIVAYAYDVDEKLKNIIEDYYINGKYGLGLDEYNMSEIAGLLKPLLAEYGKDFYDIKFVKAEDIASGMSINDKDGVVYINTYGQGFGHSTEMLDQLGHEGMHGTYADKNVDEKAASMLTKIPSKGWSSSIGATAITINAKGMIEASTNQYYKDKVNGDLRDIFALREGKNDDGNYINDSVREKLFNNAYSKFYTQIGDIFPESIINREMREQLATIFARKSLTGEITSEEEEYYFNFISTIGKDTYRKIPGKNKDEVIIVTTNRLSDDELKNSTTNEYEKAFTYLIRNLIDADEYFSIQVLSKLNKMGGLSSSMVP
ncbi:hypothetical protein [Fusobacterium sp. PH5-44]|uniref:hypothetical protein n=1 Tax=unclassified Fusobacterium TaxID=2648384 RepID=UPI003D1DBCEB